MSWWLKFKNWFFLSFSKKESNKTTQVTIRPQGENTQARTSILSNFSSAEASNLISDLTTLKTELLDLEKTYKETIDDIKSLKDNAQKAVDRSGQAHSFAVYGLLGVFLVLLTIVFSYFEFIYSGIKSDDYKYNISERINNNENLIKMLKICLNSSGWLDPKCLEN